jgi:hypothetical protein
VALQANGAGQDGADVEVEAIMMAVVALLAALHEPVVVRLVVVLGARGIAATHRQALRIGPELGAGAGNGVALDVVELVAVVNAQLVDVEFVLVAPAPGPAGHQ